MFRWLYKLPLRLRSLFRKSRVEKELSDELRFHLEKLIEEKVGKGMTPEEARHAALRELGGVEQIKEECRDMRRVNYIESVFQDLRYGLRMLRKKPGFTFIVVVTLSLGIGLNSAIFSLVGGLLIRKPPVKNPESLMTVMLSNPSKGWPRGPASAVEFSAWRDQNDVFESVGAGSFDQGTMTNPGEPVRLSTGRVTPNYFELFGVSAGVGGTFSPNEDLARQESSAVISYDLWQRRFGANPSLIGKTITLAGQNYTVIGVMPREFRYAFFPCDVWVPGSFSAQALPPKERHSHSLNVFARLRRGVGAEKAQAELSTILQRIAREDAEEKDWTAKLMRLQDLMVDKNTRTSIAFLMAIVTFVLLIACANLAGIYLARSATRQQEFAVRVALGARRARLVQQLLSESLVLSLLGGAVGLLFSFWCVRVVRARLSFNDYAAWLAERIQVDRSVLLFTLAISLLTAFLFALLPALQASKPDIQSALKEGGRTASSGPRQSRMRSAFVVVQIILTMVLMAGAGTMIQSVVGEMIGRLGFNPEHVLTVDLSLSGQKYADPMKQAAFFSEVVERTKSVPGVAFAAVTHGLPEASLSSIRFEVEGQPASKPEERPFSMLHLISPDYFRVMSIPLMRGRSFSASDTAAGSKVAIVNEAFLKRFYPKSDPVGRHIRTFKSEEGVPELRQIIGMVGNVKEHLGGSDNVLQMYVPFVQDPTEAMTLVLRTNSDPASLASAVRGAIWAVDKGQPIGSVKTMTHVIDEAGAGDRFMGEILGVFTGLALLLAGIGIYGVVAYLVAQRTHEIGLRMALGARKQDVLWLIVRRGAILSGIGIMTGYLLSFPIPRILLSAYGEADTSIRNSLVLVIAPVLVTVVALLASYLPARRATKIDPMVALRCE